MSCSTRYVLLLAELHHSGPSSTSAIIAKIIGSVEVFIQWQIKRLPSESSIEYWHEYNTGVQDDVSLCYDFTFYTDSD